MGGPKSLPALRVPDAWVCNMQCACTMPWHIYHDGSNRWRWERLDRKHKVLAHSMVAFESRDECLKDAQHHGYSGKHGGPMDHGADELNDC